MVENSTKILIDIEGDRRKKSKRKEKDSGEVSIEGKQRRSNTGIRKKKTNMKYSAVSRE